MALVQQTSEGDKSWREPTVTTTELFPLPSAKRAKEMGEQYSFVPCFWRLATKKPLIAPGIPSHLEEGDWCDPLLWPKEQGWGIHSCAVAEPKRSL